MEHNETTSTEELARRMSRVALGAVGLAAASLSGLFGASVKEGEQTPEGPTPVDLLALVSWTALWAGTEVLQRVLDTAGAAASQVSSAATSIGRGPLRGPSENLRGKLSELGRQGRAEQDASQQEAREFVVNAVGQVVNGVLDQIDLNQVVGRVDVDAIIARVDIDRIAQGIDLDALVGRIDVNEIAARIDIEAIIGRLDLAAIAKGVMDELQMNEIIRESAGAMTTETVDTLRVQGVVADQMVSRIVDRILRRDERDLKLPEPVEPDGRDHG